MDANGESKGVAVHRARPGQHIDTPNGWPPWPIYMYNAANHRPGAMNIVQQNTL